MFVKSCKVLNPSISDSSFNAYVCVHTEKISMTLMARCDFPKSSCKNKDSFLWTSHWDNEVSVKWDANIFTLEGNSTKWGSYLGWKRNWKNSTLILCDVNKNIIVRQKSQHSLVGQMMASPSVHYIIKAQNCRWKIQMIFQLISTHTQQRKEHYINWYKSK